MFVAAGFSELPAELHFTYFHNTESIEKNDTYFLIIWLVSLDDKNC